MNKTTETTEGPSKGRSAKFLQPIAASLRKENTAAHTLEQRHIYKNEVKRPSFMRFPAQDQMLFAKRLGMILRSGMPIMEGLHMLRDEKHSRSCRFVYSSITTDVQNGLSLSAGMQKFERHFGQFSINIVRIGEASGTLHQNLEYLAEEMKKKRTLKKKVIGALIYPAIIVTATTGIVVMLTVFIFPKIIPIFSSLNSKLPLSTLMLIVISNFLSHWGLEVLAGLVAIIVGVVFAMRFPAFHLLMDRLILRIPLLGKLSLYYNLSNICRTMSLLLRSDIRIVSAMELVADSTRNLVYRQALNAAKENLLTGQRISIQFKNNQNIFPSLMCQMVTVAETTGNLSGAFGFLSDMYEEEIGELTKNLTTLLEPILMIIMGLLVGFIAISIITPIYSITQSLNPH